MCPHLRVIPAEVGGRVPPGMARVLAQEDLGRDVTGSAAYLCCVCCVGRERGTMRRNREEVECVCARACVLRRCV